MPVDTRLKLHDPLTPSTWGVSTIDASQHAADPAQRAGGLDAVWELLHLKGNPPAPAQLPTELGPFAWNPATSDEERPVGGWAKLALRENGSVCFSGNFYVPGAPSDVTACVFSVRMGGGTVYTLVRAGGPHGVFGDESRHDRDEDVLDEPPASRSRPRGGRFRSATTSKQPPTVWWQVRVVSTDAYAAGDVASACRRASRRATN
jgi:hypothetical protein